MVKKYTMSAGISSQILTSDVYLAAYLLTQHCKLIRVLKNDRRRVSFLIEGNNAAELKEAYKKGPVYLNVRFFRDQLITIRRTMDDKQRSVSCPQRFPKASLRA